ncbi:MAG: hypothetical protein MZV49_09050 [Rhodopseudomonas palustris]|nr:hypothetical protein [Rhodopseudomonas palustris]
MRTLPVGITLYQGEFAFPWPHHLGGADRRHRADLRCMIAVFQERVVGGLTSGGVKGQRREPKEAGASRSGDATGRVLPTRSADGATLRIAPTDAEAAARSRGAGGTRDRASGAPRL